MENAKNNSTAHNIHVRILKLCTVFMHTLWSKKASCVLILL